MNENYKAVIRLLPIVTGCGLLVLPITENLLNANMEFKVLVESMGIGITSSLIIYVFATLNDKTISLD